MKSYWSQDGTFAKCLGCRRQLVTRKAQDAHLDRTHESAECNQTNAAFFQPFKNVAAARRISQEALHHFLSQGPANLSDDPTNAQRTCAARNLYAICATSEFKMASSMMVWTADTTPHTLLGTAGEWVGLHDPQGSFLSLLIARVTKRELPVHGEHLIWHLKFAREETESEWVYIPGKHPASSGHTLSDGARMLDLIMPDLDWVAKASG
jgi:hypothetical protein